MAIKIKGDTVISNEENLTLHGDTHQLDGNTTIGTDLTVSNDVTIGVDLEVGWHANIGGRLIIGEADSKTTINNGNITTTGSSIELIDLNGDENDPTNWQASYIVNGTPGQVIKIPVGTIHRVENKEKEDLIFIETQTGTYFGEDDIVRIEDDYGRNKNED